MNSVFFVFVFFPLLPTKCIQKPNRNTQEAVMYWTVGQLYYYTRNLGKQLACFLQLILLLGYVCCLLDSSNRVCITDTYHVTGIDCSFLPSGLALKQCGNRSGYASSVQTLLWDFFGVVHITQACREADSHGALKLNEETMQQTPLILVHLFIFFNREVRWWIIKVKWLI